MIRTLALLAALTAIAIPIPASADESAHATAGENELLLTVEVESPALTSSATTNASNAEVAYVLDPMCIRGQGGQPTVYYGCGEQATCGDIGLLYNVLVVTPTDVTPAGTTCIDEGGAAPEDVLTPGRILEAFRRIPVPTPQVGVNPVGGRTLVNFDTILHTEAEPFTTTVTLLRRQVTFDITPSEFTWRTGQGDFTTTEPGREYRASLPMSAYVTHRYLRAGKVDLGLDTTWTARWRVGDGPWQPVDGTVTTRSPSVPLEVVTARPQLISYD